MTMSDQSMDEIIDRVRDGYHAPPETPRDEIWRVVSQRIAAEAGPSADPAVIDLGRERSRRLFGSHALWGTAAAAAALLVLGIGIGRMTVPDASMPTAPIGAPIAEEAPTERGALSLAAREHLGRTESLLTMVRAEARSGDLDPATTAWARDLLVETRLLLDARGAGDRDIDLLLQDLELVLAQIVGVGELEWSDGPRARTELDLAISGLEGGEVLPRIQAALPRVQAGA
jgi:hypothetical protein